MYEESESTQISLELKWDRLFQIYFGLSFTASPEGIQATLFCVPNYTEFLQNLQEAPVILLRSVYIFFTSIFM
jgi:hypothetical protein